MLIVKTKYHTTIFVKHWFGLKTHIQQNQLTFKLKIFLGY